jgi:hypothetical protein
MHPRAGSGKVPVMFGQLEVSDRRKSVTTRNMCRAMTVFNIPRANITAEPDRNHFKGNTEHGRLLNQTLS